MTTRVWTGGTARLADPNAWTPAGKPVAGDSLDIVSGTAEVNRGVLLGLSIQLGEGSFSSLAVAPAILQIRDSIIAPSTTIAVGGITLGASYAGLPSGTIEASGVNLNSGTITVAGFSPAAGGFPGPGQLTIDVRGSVAIFVNTGTLSTGDTPSTLEVDGQSGDAVLSNNQLIDSNSVVKLTLDVIGVGKMAFGVPYYLGPSPHALTGPAIETTHAVGFGQTVDFMAASGADSHGKLSIGDPRDFHALIRDFVSSVDSNIIPDLHEDLIALNLPNLMAATYQGNTTGGVLSLTGAGDQVAHLRFSGSYSLASFQITNSSSGTDIVIKSA